jgi:hypothetical protein
MARRSDAFPELRSLAVRPGRRFVPTSAERSAVLGLRVGDVVKVRTEEEILGTLDAEARLDGLPLALVTEADDESVMPEVRVVLHDVKQDGSVAIGTIGLGKL